MGPIIGLTCDYDVKANGREVACLYPSYFDAVEQSGGVPLLLPPMRDPAAMRAALSHLDGVLLTGGDDYSPALWGEEPHSANVPLRPRREQFDLAFAKELLATDVPVLAICGGMQLINIARGGTLLQHVPDDVPGALVHALPAEDVAIHDIEVAPRSLMNPTDEPMVVAVRSYHHQAIHALASGLRVTARSADGVIEMLESDNPACQWLGVQWHPEKHLPAVGPNVEFHLGLFQWLVRAAHARGEHGLAVA